MEVITCGGMTSMNKIGRLPLLLKEAEISLPLKKVTIQATAIRKRDIQLLEWAIMAPLASLDPVPSLDEIAQEFGIEPVDFLHIVAEKLKVMGLLYEIGLNNYQLTDIGRKFFAEGKVISDPRDIQLQVYYHDKTKEWIYGFSKEVDLSSKDADIEMYIPNIGIPEKIVVDHLQKQKELEKNESISTYTIKEVVPFQIKFNVKFLLKSDGIAVIPVQPPFGEENKQRVITALRKEVLTPLKLKQCLKDFYTILDNFESTVRLQPHELADSQLFTPASEDTLIEYLLAKKPRYLISNRNNMKSINFGKAVPRLLFTKNPYSDCRTDGSIIRNVVNFQTDGLLTEYAYITDILAVKVVTVVYDDIEIPLFQVKEHGLRDEEISTILEYIGSLSFDGDTEEFEQNFAIFYVDPNEKSFDRLITSLDSMRKNMGYQSNDRDKLLLEIISLRTLILGSPQGKIERNLIYDLLNSFSWENLLEIDPSVLEVYTSCYIDSVHSFIKSVSIEGELHPLLDDYSNLFNKLDKYIQNHSTEIELLRSSYIDTLARSFNAHSSILSKKDIELGTDILFKISDEKRKNILGQSLLSALTFTIMPIDKKIPLLLRLAEMNINPDVHYVRQIGKKMFSDLGFNLYDPGFFIKVQNIITNCKILNPSCEIEKSFDIPELTIAPSKPDDITNLIMNLFELDRILTSLDSQKISEVLQKVSSRLCTSGDPEKLRLWVDLLVLIRPHEKEKAIQFIPVTDSEIISTLSSLNVEEINKMKKKLKLLNVYSILNKSVGTLPDMNNKSESDSPLGGIIIDGSNVAYAGQDGKKPRAEQIIQAYKDLKSLGYDPVFVIVGASLRHSMNKQEYENMERHFQHISEKNQKTVFQQAPAGHDDDYFIINIAIENDMRILTNDLYRDTIQNDPKKKDEIESRLVKYMFNPEEHTLIPSENFNPKKKAEKLVES